MGIKGFRNNDAGLVKRFGITYNREETILGYHTEIFKKV